MINKDDVMLIDVQYVRKDKENIPYLKNNSDIDLLKLYVSQLPGPLSEQELIDALTKMINGDEKYIDIIVEHNLRFVVYLAKSCIRDGISIFDLILNILDHFVCL